MQALFYAPVRAHRMGKQLGIGGDGVDDIALFNTAF